MFRFLLTGFILLAGSTTSLSGQELPFQEYVLPALFDPQVAEALELSRDQSNDIKMAVNDIKSTRGQLIKEFKQFAATASEAEIADRRQVLQTVLDERKTKVYQQIEAVLLPHQLDRLKQLAVQVAMKQTAKRKKLASGFLTEPVRDYLGIDDQQAKKIESESKRIQSDLQKKINELMQEAKLELLETLTPKQRKKYEEMIGEPLTARKLK